MKRIVLAAIAILTLGLSSAAMADPGLIIEKVSAQTRDGGAWQPGQAVVVTFDVRGAAGTFPEKGLAVVMQVQKERTKCLDVPLALIGQDGAAARYAGVFFPFYTAVFDGKVMFGDSASYDFTFQVDEALAPSAISASTDVPAADPQAAAPLAFDQAARVALPAALAALLVALVPLAFLRRRTLAA